LIAEAHFTKYFSSWKKPFPKCTLSNHLWKFFLRWLKFSLIVHENNKGNTLWFCILGFIKLHRILCYVESKITPNEISIFFSFWLLKCLYLFSYENYGLLCFLIHWQINSFFQIYYSTCSTGDQFQLLVLRHNRPILGTCLQHQLNFNILLYHPTYPYVNILGKHHILVWSLFEIPKFHTNGQKQTSI
jgi:hypothetical protein